MIPQSVLAQGDPPSAARAQWLSVGLLPLNVAGLAYTETAFQPGGPNATEWDSLNVQLLELLEVNLGSITLPLLKDPTNPEAVGLLELGNLGLLKSYSNSPSPNWAHAATGLLTDNGALDVSAYDDPTLSNSRLDLTALLDQVLGSGSAALLNEAAIAVGAVGSEVQVGNLDSNSVEQCAFDISNQYVLTDLKLDTASPLIGGAITAINDTDSGLLRTTVVDPLDALLGPGGGIASLVNGVLAPIEAVLNLINLGPLLSTQGTASINSLTVDTGPLLASVQQVLEEPLVSGDDSIRIDLQNGQILVDLGKYAVDASNSGKPESEWVDLSSLPANTDVLDAETITAILNGLTDLIAGDQTTHPESLSSKLIQAVNEGVYSAQLDVSLQIKLESCAVLGGCTTVLDAPVTISGTLGGFMGEVGHATPMIDVSQLTIAGIPAGLLAQPIADLLSGLVISIGSRLDTVVADPNTGILANFQRGIVGPAGVLTVLLDQLVGTTTVPGALRTLLDNVATITINRQPTPGDLGADSFTVRALEIVLLPKVTENGAVPVQFASSTALASPPTCLTVAKSLEQTSPYIWATQAQATDWALTAASTNQTATGVTGGATVTQVPVAPGEYTLSEAVGPGGITGGLAWDAYRNTWACVDGVGNPLTVVSQGGTTSYATGTVTLVSGAVAACTVTNTLATTAMSWQKVDAGSPGTPLNGSTWLLRPLVAPTQPIDVELVNTATGTGEFTVPGLPPGDYELEETASPVGYRALTAPLEITMHADGTVSGFPTEGRVVNEQVPVPGIPLTGGWSAQIFTLVGALALLTAIGVAIWGYRRRTAEDERGEA